MVKLKNATSKIKVKNIADLRDQKFTSSPYVLLTDTDSASETSSLKSLSRKTSQKRISTPSKNITETRSKSVPKPQSKIVPKSQSDIVSKTPTKNKSSTSKSQTTSKNGIPTPAKATTSTEIVASPETSNGTPTKTSTETSIKERTSTIYHCQKCNKTFTRKPLFLDHLNEHKSHINHKCNICDKTFRLVFQLNQHMKTHQHDCSKCEETFVTLKDLQVHEETHEVAKDYQCVICGLEYAEMDELKEHLPSHCGEKLYPCKCCNKRFSFFDLKKHHEKVKESSGYQFNVDDDDASSVKSEIRASPDKELERSSITDTIDENHVFFIDMDEDELEIIDTEPEIIETKVDEKLVDEKPIIILDDDEEEVIEIRRTSTQIFYKCTLCQEPFDSIENLKQHQVIHTDEVVKAFLTNANLINEIHACILCDKTFVSIEYLRKHQSIHHQLDDQNESSIEILDDITETVAEVPQTIEELPPSPVIVADELIATVNEDNASKEEIAVAELLVSLKDTKGSFKQDEIPSVGKRKSIPKKVSKDPSEKKKSSGKVVSKKSKKDQVVPVKETKQVNKSSNSLKRKSATPVKNKSKDKVVEKFSSSTVDKKEAESVPDFETSSDDMRDLANTPVNADTVFDNDGGFDSVESSSSEEEAVTRRKTKKIVKNIKVEVGRKTSPKRGKSKEKENPIPFKKSGGKLTCHKCGRKFRLRRNLLKHMPIHDNDDDTPFQCTYCGKTLQNKEALGVHEKNHNIEKTRKCPKCGKMYQSAFHLKRHLQSHIDKETEQKCEHCGRVFAVAAYLKRHLLIHFGIKPFKCTECDETFRHRLQLTKHYNKSHGGNKYRCDLCSKTFYLPEYLKKHYLIHTDEKPFECDECDESFKHPQQLIRHRKVHNEGINRFLCHNFELCERSFTHIGYLEHHQKVCRREDFENKVTFPCTICNKKFASRAYLRKHRFLHTGEKPYQCSKCDKRFAMRTNLQQHEKNHDVRLECNVCGKNFVNHIVLKTHKKIHAKEKPHKCTMCTESFTTYSLLKQHERLHLDASHRCLECNETFNSNQLLQEHQQETRHRNDTEIEPPKKYSCTLCAKKFPNPSYLKIHQYIHRGVKPHKCKYCPRTFTLKAHLGRHENSHNHDGDVYECNICGKRFKKRGKWITHKETHSIDIPYKCEICDKGFSKPHLVKQHMVVHAGARPYKCHKCHKSFNQQAHLKFHGCNESQVGLYARYKCNQCGKTFPRREALLSHQRLHQNEKPHICVICGRSFELLKYLKRHQKIHTDSMVVREEIVYEAEKKHTYGCDTCSAEFHSQSSLNNHSLVCGNVGMVQETVIEDKQERPYVCVSCGKAFVTNIALKRHEAAHLEPEVTVYTQEIIISTPDINTS